MIDDKMSSLDVTEITVKSEKTHSDDSSRISTALRVMLYGSKENADGDREDWGCENLRDILHIDLLKMYCKGGFKNYKKYPIIFLCICICITFLMRSDRSSDLSLQICRHLTAKQTTLDYLFDEYITIKGQGAPLSAKDNSKRNLQQYLS